MGRAPCRRPQPGDPEEERGSRHARRPDQSAGRAPWRNIRYGEVVIADDRAIVEWPELGTWAANAGGAASVTDALRAAMARTGARFISFSLRLLLSGVQSGLAVGR